MKSLFLKMDKTVALPTLFRILWYKLKSIQMLWYKVDICSDPAVLPFYIQKNVHAHLNFTIIFVKNLILCFKNNFTRINHCKFIHHTSHFKPFLSYLPCIVHRKYFSIIFHVKKCTLYLIKYGNSKLSGSCCIKLKLIRS
jgi:hypothetical protein